MYDYIIIGSGPSGGVLAKNLTDAGAKCLLLEAGQFFRKDTFPRNEADFSAQLFWGGGLEFNDKATMAFLRARCVGGTSIVNQCLLDRFDDEAFADWRDRSGVDFFHLDQTNSLYDRVLENVALHTFERTEFIPNAELFTTACDKLGHKWHYLHRGQSDCKLEDGNDCIGCLGGCHRDSKQSALVTCIQPAEEKGLEIEAEFMVDRLEHHADHVKVFGSQRGKARQLQAPKVIVAAPVQVRFQRKTPCAGPPFFFSSTIHVVWAV